MKQVIYAASTLALCLSSCTKTIIIHPSDTETMARYGYVKAQPAQAKVYSNNPDAAFDHQVATYSAEQATAPQAAVIPTPQTNPSPSNLTVDNLVSPIVTNPVTTALVNTINQGEAAATETPAPQVEVPAPVIPAQPAQNQNAGVMDYKVKITNGTPNRLFIEAQDANGTIYPCGFMQPGQSETSKMEQVQAVAGPVLVVIRDPDQPGAPELRRYRIATPNQSYAGKTLEFTVIPKGRYAAAIDGQTYLQSQSDD